MGLAQSTRSLVWERYLGRPLTLGHLLQSAHVPSAPMAVDCSISEARVTRWGAWPADAYWTGRADEVRGWEVRDGQYRPCRRSIPLTALTETVSLPDFRCDIGDVEGLAASKSPLGSYTSLDDFAIERCAWLLASISTDTLERALAHHEIRILRGGDSFSQYGWDGRLFLSNSGGSHHFAAARFLARHLGHRVPLHGTLNACHLVPSAVDALCSGYDIYAPSVAPNALHAALEAIGATYFIQALPAPYSGVEAVFLPRDVPRSLRASRAFHDSGVFDVSEHLRAQLARQCELQRDGIISAPLDGDSPESPRPW